MSDLSSTLGEKIQEHQEEPIITSASGKVVTQDESTSSKGFTKAPIITEMSKPPAQPPPTIQEIILSNILSVSDSKLIFACKLQVKVSIPF